MSGEASPELVEIIRQWLMSTDYPVTDWERQFATAIEAMMRAAGWTPPEAKAQHWPIERVYQEAMRPGSTVSPVACTCGQCLECDAADYAKTKVQPS